MERDLAALEDKVSTLGQEADRLCGIHADHAEQIQAKRAEIESYWQRLRAKAKVNIYFNNYIYSGFKKNWSSDMVIVC